MKNIYLILAAILILAMLLLPLIAITENSNAITDIGQGPGNETPVMPASTDTFRVLMSESNQVIEISAEDYVFGVVAAEMSVNNEPEALKAQAVAAYTFALYKKGKNSAQDYDISDSFKTDQAYIPREQARQRWGDKADENEAKLNDIVKSVYGEYMSYGGAPIFAAYHAMSSGRTESSENIWDKALPYLVAKESVGDKLQSNYISVVTVSIDEFKSKMEGCNFEGDAAGWFGAVDRTESGTVKSITICKNTYKGSEIREKFELRSPAFEVTADGTNVTFTVRGYGHGVGMSQCGANYMAQQGSGYREILSWYYTSVEFCKIQ